MTTLTDIRAEVTGTLWKILVNADEHLPAGASVAIVESMKMEIPIETPVAGKVVEFLFEEGAAVEEGEVIARYACD